MAEKIDDRPEWNFAQHYPRDAGKLADYFKRTGRPILSRLDLRVTSMEELRWVTVLISRLNHDLQALAFDDERDQVLRVILARDVLASARISLKYLKPNVKAKPVKRVKKPAPVTSSSTTSGVPPSQDVGKLDSTWTRPVLPRQPKER